MSFQHYIETSKAPFQGGDIEELEHVVDAQGIIIAWQRRTIDDLKATVASLQHGGLLQEQLIERQQFGNKVLEKALRVMGDVRDAQEDKLDKQTEVIDGLSAELRSAHTRIHDAEQRVHSLQEELERVQHRQATLEPAKEPERKDNIPDQELYGFLVAQGEHQLAAKLQESARSLERLHVVDREWMYKTSGSKKQSASDDGKTPE